jgi:hypothetical protein
MGVVAFTAVISAALRFRTPLWGEIVSVLGLGLLCTGILKVVRPLSTSRMMWLGFVVFGVAYFISPSFRAWGPPFDPLYVIGAPSIYVGENYENDLAVAQQIVHWVLTLLSGLVGALVGRLLAAPADARTEPAP